jgi:hypothetical protein
MNLEKIDKEDLSNLLVEKHKNFIKDYKKEYDILDRIAILKEKKEQLEYWVQDSKDNPAKNQKYLQAAKDVEKEFSNLTAELKSLYESSPSRVSGSIDSDHKARHKWLKGQIALQDEALNYWTAKIKEVSEAKKQKEEAKDSQAPLKKVKKIKKDTKKIVKSVKSGKKKASAPPEGEE